MKKLSSIFFLCLIFILFSSCERPDLTGDVEYAYDVAKNNACSEEIDGYMWSPKASSIMNWSDSIDYCNNLTACGYSDWHLPTISELRTLIQNCSRNEMPSGTCGVRDDDEVVCLESSCWTSETCGFCSSDSSDKYSKFGETGWFWSSSTRSDKTDHAWLVDFYNGDVNNYDKINVYNVRCVR